MNSIVIYSSRHGNTEKVAESIAVGLSKSGPTKVCAIADAPLAIPDGVDLVVIGGPTEAHGITKPLAGYLKALGPDGMVDKAAVAFDTRLDAPRWLSGSAALSIAKRLRDSGAEIIAEPVSFFVSGKEPELQAGELERAEAWAGRLGQSLGQQTGEVTVAKES